MQLKSCIAELQTKEDRVSLVILHTAALFQLLLYWVNQYRRRKVVRLAMSLEQGSKIFAQN